MRHPGDPCPYCERPLTKELLDKNRAEASRSRLESFNERKRRGMNVGRPRTAPYEEIRKLRKTGLSYRKIAQALKVSLCSVQRAVETEVKP